MVNEKISQKKQRVEELEFFLKDMETRSKRYGIVFRRDYLPGSKRDFQVALKNKVPLFSGISEGTIEQYLGILKCRFPNGGGICAKDKTVRRLYPECFKNNVERKINQLDFQ